jgi:tetratricopeptide (TPR) repeat protein
LACAKQLEQVGHRQQNTVVLLMAHLYQAIVRQTLGESATAFSLLKECLKLNDPAYRSVSAALTPEDPYLMTLSWIAVVSGTLGYIEQARAHISEALSVVAQLEKSQRQAYSHCFVLIFAGGTEQIAGSPSGMKRYSETLTALADEHGFPYLWTCGLCNCGMAATALGDPSKGLSLLDKGLTTNRVIGSAWGTAWYLISQADAQSQLGQFDSAVNLLKEAEVLIRTTGERLFEPELFMVRGALASNAGDDAAAEQHYRQALDIARRQSARVYELRAATNLARLWRDQGKRVHARDLLAPIYGWFTEGLDAPVLQEAKALLEQLKA